MIQTWKRSATFAHTVTSGEAAANQVVLSIASGNAPTNDYYFIGQVRRGGVDTTGFKFTYTSGDGLMTVADDGSANLTTGDVIVIMGSYAKAIKT